MADEEELGAALADALRARVRDIEPTDRLRDWVKTELRSRPNASAQPKRTRRRWALTILTPTTAVAAAIVVLLLGTQAPPSFAVARTPAGLVRVTLRDIEGVRGANTKLLQLGVRNITVVPVMTGCSSHLQLLFTGIGPHQGGAEISINPNEIPRHTTDVLAARQLPSGDIALGIGRTHGPPPVCVAPVRFGVGIPPSPTHAP